MRGIGWVYAVIWLAAAAVVIAVRLGWSPAWNFVWDGTAQVCVVLAMPMVMVLAGIGLVTRVDVGRLPRLLRLVPLMTAFTVSSFLTLGIARISAESTPDEIALDLGRTLPLGIGAGLVTGLLLSSGLDKREGLWAVPLWKVDRAVIVMIAIVAAIPVALIAVPRERDDGKTTLIAGFGTRSGSLMVLTQTVPLTAGRYGVVAVSDAKRSNNLVLGRQREWGELETLWVKATTTRTAALTYVGEVHGTGPDSPQLQLSAGTSGARFRVVSGRRPALTYDLPAAEYDHFGAALHRVRKWLWH
jgi:hypothetical protein